MELAFESSLTKRWVEELEWRHTQILQTKIMRRVGAVARPFKVVAD
jgi:hypothetical protein